VAIVGRPNVGKSTLFNRIVGARTAIVEDRARTTRDRLYGEADWNGRRFVVVDTGGLERRPGDAIEARVQDQARVAIAEADVIVLVVDAAAGETPGDVEAAELLRGARVPVVVAVNKADNLRREYEGAEFHRFGWAETHQVSALHARGTGDLMDAVVEALPPVTDAELELRRREEMEIEAEELAADAGAGEGEGPGEELHAGAEGVEAAWDRRVERDRALDRRPLAVAIVGRPNVGKSSLLNALLGEERMIVSDIPGTTRDAVDTPIAWDGRDITLIDTAGLRRRGAVARSDPADRFSALRALRAIGRSDVAVLVIDAVDGLTRQDAHVAGYVVEEGKGLVLALNKWDLVEKDQSTFDAYVARLRREAPFVAYAPVIAISAKTGLRCSRVLDSAVEIAGEHRRRVSTADLNRLVAEAVFRQAPPAVRGKRPKVFYATQAAVAPPTFVFFVSDADAIHFSYERYLENRVREAFDFRGTPLRLVFRTRSRTQVERRRERGATGRGATGRGATGRGGSARGRPRR
jgi:GTP-binding protein